MTNIREYVLNNLLDPLKVYPTDVQNALIEMMIQRLEELYDLIVQFPEIILPYEDRMDIVKVICAQFRFTIPEESDLLEQLSILESIIEVYQKRGSIDTIENMWVYYGGKLPKKVTVSIPSYNLFRYSISPYSTVYFYPDGQYKRTGVLDVIIEDDDLQMTRDEILAFLHKELIPAGTLVNLILPEP